MLQVTRQDEEIQAREAQLQKAKDNLSKLEHDFSELDRKNQQVHLFLLSMLVNQNKKVFICLISTFILMSSLKADGGEVSAD